MPNNPGERDCSKKSKCILRCMYACIYTHTRVHAFIHTYVCMHLYTHVCMHLYTHVCMHVNMTTNCTMLLYCRKVVLLKAKHRRLKESLCLLSTCRIRITKIVCILLISYQDTLGIDPRAQVANTSLPAASGPPPCFIWPGTLLLPSDSAELLLNC